MTENKRFKPIIDGVEDILTGEKLNNQFEVSLKLNELSDENEQLKQFINELTSRDGRIWLSSGYVYDVKKVLKGDDEI